MSIPVPLPELRAAVAEAGPTVYLVTVDADGRPRTVAISVRFENDLLIAPAGRSTLANVAARPLVSLLWAARSDGGYSLIVDGEADVKDDVVTVRPSRAVWHRPAQTADGAVTSDCRPVTPVASGEVSDAHDH